MASDVLPKPVVAYCKKCTVEHEKPVGTKCERIKNVSKDSEKWDPSHEILSAKKTPKGKAVDTSDKMLDLVMNTMSNLTEKLAAMDERITGLASKIELTPAKPTA